MINFTHVYKTYSGPVNALKNVNINISKGEFVFLTGPSGAGKSTLFRLLSAFDKASSGLIKVSGYNLDEITQQQVPYFRRKIGVVYQDFKLLKNRTVFENIALPLEILGEKDKYIQKRVNTILGDVNLDFKKNKYPAELSGGEQQRVAIARALVHHPGILIADEPTGNLDPDLTEDIINLFEKVNAQGTTVFIATHDHDMVKRRKKRVLHLEDGEVKKG
jgi:cell division transport system ATP-binding protein